MMWMYHITAEKTKEGFYSIPETCVNAKWGNFENLLKMDDYAVVRSAIVNWFNDVNGNVPFSVNFNGNECIYLQANKQMEEFYFHSFSVIDDYLFHHESEEEYSSIRKKYLDNKIILQRKDKLKKITDEL